MFMYRLCRKCTRRHGMLGFICGVVICVLTFELQRQSSTHFNMAQLRQGLLRPPFSAKEQGKHDVIISAYMNSGSRLTGQLLGFINQSFYFYEPLWKFTIWDYYRPPDVRCSSTEGSCRYVNIETENSFHPDQFGIVTEPIVPDLPRQTKPVELMVHVLSSVFRCEFVRLKNVIQERVQDHPNYSGPSWLKYRECMSSFNPKSKCLRELEDVCRSKTHRVLKVLRLSISAFRPLLEINPRLKIVHLVRDPRAIINSRLYSRFYPVANPKTNDSLEKNLCDKMLSDSNEAMMLKDDFPGRVIFLYYEDLINNLPVKLKQLYDKLNLTFNMKDMNEFGDIKINLSPPEKGSNFTRDRKHSNAVWWRKYMPMEQIKRVDEKCYDVYKILGYKTLTEEHIRDLAYSNYEIPENLNM